MTSYILRSVQERNDPYHPMDENCTFCRIVAGKSEAFVVYEDEHCLGFLDILPMRPGHTLLVPKAHYARLADLPEDLGAKMGAALPKVVKAVCEATDNPDLNVVCNQGYAQAVHIHWHLIPAPKFDQAATASSAKDENESPRKQAVPHTHKFMLRGEMAYRDFLDDDEAEQLAKNIKSRL